MVTSLQGKGQERRGIMQTATVSMELGILQRVEKFRSAHGMDRSV